MTDFGFGQNGDHSEVFDRPDALRMDASSVEARSVKLVTLIYVSKELEKLGPLASIELLFGKAVQPLQFTLGLEKGGAGVGAPEGLENSSAQGRNYTHWPD